jgi:hypothetical protein
MFSDEDRIRAVLLYKPYIKLGKRVGHCIVVFDKTVLDGYHWWISL